MIKINNDYFITLLVAIIKKHFFTIRINFKTEILSRSLIIKICLLVSQTLPFRRIKNQSRRRRRRRRRRQPMTSSASQKQKREILNFFNDRILRRFLSHILKLMWLVNESVALNKKNLGDVQDRQF